MRGSFSLLAERGRPLAALAALWAVTCLGGCRPAVEVSEGAAALDPIETDPLEDGQGADVWPGFRGPNSQGVAPAGKPAVEFGTERGVRWSTEVPGSGSSSPVVWKNQVLLTSALDEGSPPQLAVLCYDRRDGRELWRAEAGPASGPTHTKNGFASASVATDGQRVVAFFGTTGLFCFDMGGKRLWRTDLGDLGHRWGTASSPVLHGDLVIQLCDCARDSYLAAFRKTDGGEVWRTPRTGDGCWSTPVIVEARDDDGTRRTEIVVNGGASEDVGQRSVTAYHLDDGRELWRVSGLTEWVAPVPLVRGGLVYSACGRNGPIMAIRPGGSGDVTETRVLWKVLRGGPYIPSGLVYRNRVYMVNEPGFVTCYNAGTGEQIWSERLRDTFTASLVAADGRIYATSEWGKVYVFAARDAAEKLAENDMGEPCLATPAIAGGELFIRTKTRLYCIAGE